MKKTTYQQDALNDFLKFEKSEVGKDFLRVLRCHNEQFKDQVQILLRMSKFKSTDKKTVAEQVGWANDLLYQNDELINDNDRWSWQAQTQRGYANKIIDIGDIETHNCLNDFCKAITLANFWSEATAKAINECNYEAYRGGDDWREGMIDGVFLGFGGMTEPQASA